ncbi:IS110 family transposase [Bradyrhizobium sp. MOS003]|uniref:IS110 family transposase n=1 Tax=Bradyrhizobium sp. MOS003 TaxID=2133946 RepID=UPI0032DF7FB6
MVLNIATHSSGSVWLNRAGVATSARGKFHIGRRQWMNLSRVVGQKGRNALLLVSRQQRENIGLPELRQGTEVRRPATGVRRGIEHGHAHASGHERGKTWSACLFKWALVMTPKATKKIISKGKGQKNDFNDAEAVQRPTMKFVATKTAEQLDLQALHRVRERLVSQRTGIINQIRAFMLERGIAVRQGIGFLRTELPTILATRTEALSPRMLRVIEELAGDWRRLDQRIDGLSGEIEALARQDQACSRLMTVPGIGPVISSAMVAAIGTGDVFSKGRDFGAWLGLVPKQISTGDRTILGKISRRGNRYLRVLFVQAAWVVLVRMKNWERYGLKSWIEAAKRRLHHNVLAIALANKLARIAWAVLAKGRAFELTRTDDAGVRPA